MILISSIHSLKLKLLSHSFLLLVCKSNFPDVLISCSINAVFDGGVLLSIGLAVLLNVSHALLLLSSNALIKEVDDLKNKKKKKNKKINSKPAPQF